jgi:hypothetical protein
MRDFGRDYDKWLDERDNESSSYYYAYQNAKQQFLEGVCNPHDIDVFMDALAEGVVKDDDLKAAIALGDDGYEQIGKVFWDAVQRHCEWKAKGLAIAQLSRT